MERLNTIPVLLIKELTPVQEIRKQGISESLVDELLQHGFFNNGRFTFVGIYYSDQKNISVIGYPKYIEREDPESIDDILRHMELVCKVIAGSSDVLNRSLVESSYNFSTNDSALEFQHISRYDLAVFLLEDYIEHGVYFERTRHRSKNTGGPIDWSYTIRSVQPLISQDVVYVETVKRHTRNDAAPLLTSLHTWVINECARLLNGLGRYSGLHLPEISDGFVPTALDQYVPYILSKLPYVYRQREINLLKALSAWCGQSKFYRTQFGVTAFELVWENAARQVFGNINKTNSNRPKYVIAGTEYLGRGDMRPDILRVFTDASSEKGYVGILDAKYYVPCLDHKNGQINGAPPNTDITKQISYYRDLRQQYPSAEVLFTNVFLLPRYEVEEGDLYTYVGYAVSSSVRYEAIQDILKSFIPESSISTDYVLVYEVNPTMLYQAFLDGELVDDIRFVTDFIVPFQRLEASTGYPTRSESN